MKKVKLMLLSLSILAVVGGALAFAAKTGIQFCIAPTILDSNGNITCPSFCPNLGKLKSGPVTSNVCTTITSGDPENPCPPQTICIATNPGKTIE